MSIKGLPASAVRLIGSTQVITSVFSVVKELIENSLDGGASVVEVKLENFGIDRIEVRDNGQGISARDISVVAKPHYTSKVTTTEDLSSLSTYGFRGEALGCLCAVSEVAITTKTCDDDVSFVYCVDHKGDVISKKPSHLPQGTTICAANLFRNLPVRKQYYGTEKKKKESLKKVEDLVIAYALIRPDVRFVLRHNKEIIWQLLKKCYSAAHKLVTARCPVAFVHIQLPAAQLDVNLDPNKTTVFLHNKEEILKFLESVLDEIYPQFPPVESPNKENEGKSHSVNNLKHGEDANEFTASRKVQGGSDAANNSAACSADLSIDLCLDDIDFAAPFDSLPGTEKHENVDKGNGNNVDRTLKNTERLNEVSLESVRSELSGICSEGKPLQSGSYGRRDEESRIESGNSRTVNNAPENDRQLFGNANTTGTLSDIGITNSTFGSLNSQIDSKEKEKSVCKVTEGNQSSESDKTMTKQCRLSTIQSCISSPMVAGNVSTNDSTNYSGKKGSPRSANHDKSSTCSGPFPVTSTQLPNQSGDQPKNDFTGTVKADQLLHGLSTVLQPRRINSPQTPASTVRQACKRRKIDPGKNQRNIQAMLTSPKASLHSNKPPPATKTRTAKFSMKALKDTLGTQPSGSSQSWSRTSCSTLQLIGCLQSQSLWIGRFENSIVCFQPMRVQEQLLFTKLMQTYSLPMEELDVPIKLNPSHCGGEEGWRWLMSCQKSDGGSQDPYVYFTDPRISKNGFKIRQAKDNNSIVEIVSMTSCVRFFGLNELKEISVAMAMAEHGDVTPMEQSRPCKTKHFLQGEAVRMTRARPLQMQREEVEHLAERCSINLLPHTTKCFHGKPFLLPVYDLEQLPSSQLSSQDSVTL